MLGWYDSANGATLRGGWEPIDEEEIVPMEWAEFQRRNPGVNIVANRIRNMYSNVDENELLMAFKLAYAIDTALMMDDRQNYARMMSTLDSYPPAMQKLVRWIRRMMHSGKSKRMGAEERRALRASQRRHLRTGPWYGSDPWSGASREGWYKGLYPYMGPRSARKKGDPLPNPYTSMGWIRVTKNSKKKKVAEAGGAAAAAAAAVATAQAIQDGATPQEAVAEGAAAGQEAAADAGMQIDNIGVGEQMTVAPAAQQAQKILEKTDQPVTTGIGEATDMKQRQIKAAQRKAAREADRKKYNLRSQTQSTGNGYDWY
ncbi:TPA_asm: hypothetical protein [Bovine rumen MELD virus]|nr:TPA_asm: hypothetical protein [Bovine rumen MELD virus]